MTEETARWWVYLVQCSDQSLYVGITTDLNRRLQEHNGETRGGARYTRARRPVHGCGLNPVNPALLHPSGRLLFAS